MIKIANVLTAFAASFLASGPWNLTYGTTSVTEHQTLPDNDKNWWVSSQQLLVRNAVADAEMEVSTGNCRLIAYQGVGYIVPKSETENLDIQVKFGLIIVSDTSDLITDGVMEAMQRARDYGGPYNRVVLEGCYAAR